MLALRFILEQLIDTFRFLRRIPHAAVLAVMGTAVGVLAMVTLGRALLASAALGSGLTPSGLLLELAVAICVLGLVYLGSLVHPLLAILPATLYAAWFTANMEMAHAMDTVVDAHDVVYMADFAFLRSTGGGLAFPWFAFVFLLVCAGFAFSTTRLPRRPPGSIYMVSAILGVVVFGSAVAASPSALTWHEDSLVARSVRTSVHRAFARDQPQNDDAAPSDSSTDSSSDSSMANGPQDNPEVYSESDDERAATFEQPLVFPRAESDTPNVLLVVLEGIPGVYLQQVQEASGVSHPLTMEGLSRIAESGLTLSQSVAHSRQTIRGLYPMLTGDYPRLDMSTPKIYPYIEAAREHQPRGLPYALAQLGYHTVYLQAADLSFMSKDLFMPQVGFDEVIGSEHFDSQYVPFDWGPDDRAYFEQAADYIDNTLDGGNEPWFLTLLTVGTHHHYGVSESYAEEYPNRKAAAVAYLDEALEEFMARLEGDGVLEDTAVFLVSDESHGVGQHPFGRYWGTTVVRAPETDEHVMQEDVFGLIDVPMTILDYLGAESLAQEFGGRSALREYSSPRTMHFGPFISHSVSGRHSVFERVNRNEYAVHSPAGDGIFAAEYESSHDLSDLVSAAEQEPELGQLLEQSFERASGFAAEDLTTREGDTDPEQTRTHTWSLIEHSDYTIEAGEEATLTSAQYLEFDAGSIFTVHLEMEVDSAGEAEDGANPPEDSEILRPSLQMLSEYEPLDIELPDMPSMNAGDSFELEVTFPVTRHLSRVWFDLRASSLTDQDEVDFSVRDFSVEVRNPLPPVAHAGGTYEGHTRTNSVEALKKNSDDYTMFELDFRWTSDDRLVGLYDWDSVFERLYGGNPAQPLSFSELSEMEPEAGITPVTLDAIRSFLSENPTASIVTDVKDENLRALERIADEIPDYAERIIPQVYDPEEFGRAQKLGYERIIWTPYRFSETHDTDRVVSHVDDLQREYPDTLFAVTLPSEMATQGTPQAVARLGVPVYSYTVDDCERVEELRANGVSSVYTNELGSECDRQ